MGSSFAVELPLELVVTETLRLVAAFDTVTLALAIAAPVGSVTAPVNCPFCTWAVSTETRHSSKDKIYGVWTCFLVSIGTPPRVRCAVVREPTELCGRCSPPSTERRVYGIWDQRHDYCHRRMHLRDEPSLSLLPRLAMLAVTLLNRVSVRPNPMGFRIRVTGSPSRT